MARPKPKRDEGYNILGMPLKPGEIDSPSGEPRTSTRRMTKTKTKARSVKRAKAPGQMKKVTGIKSARTLAPGQAKSRSGGPAPKIKQRTPGTSTSTKQRLGAKKLPLPTLPAKGTSAPASGGTKPYADAQSKPMPKKLPQTSRKLGMK